MVDEGITRKRHTIPIFFDCLSTVSTADLQDLYEQDLSWLK